MTGVQTCALPIYVLQLLLGAMSNPANKSLDLNGDGTANWADAVTLVRLIKSAAE